MDASRMKTEFNIVGIMSGTSLDGIDLAYCKFVKSHEKWYYEIIHAETIKYSSYWISKLSHLENESAYDFAKAHAALGELYGELVNAFLMKNKKSCDFISSHGHTIFHQPENQLTFQIGSGASIAAKTRLPVICDFRSVDVALGGQGAPLVPIGDKFLFNEYTYRLNLGGFANISFENNDKTIAFDICPINMALNFLAQKKNLLYDENGKLAKTGEIKPDLLNKLNEIEFYNCSAPKSLGKEWFIKNFMPHLEFAKYSIEDLLRTVVEHIGIQIGKCTSINGTMLISGGGAYNDFLIERIKANTSIEIKIPDKKTIEFKEALIFAFLGLLRYTENINSLKTVTGANDDHVGGAIYKPF